MNMQKIIILLPLSLFISYQLECVKHENKLTPWVEPTRLNTVGGDQILSEIASKVVLYIFKTSKHAHQSLLQKLILKKYLNAHDLIAHFTKFDNFIEKVDLVMPTFRKDNIKFLLEDKSEIKKIIEFIIDDASYKQSIDASEEHENYKNDAERALAIATEHYFKKYPSIE